MLFISTGYKYNVWISTRWTKMLFELKHLHPPMYFKLQEYYCLFYSGVCFLFQTVSVTQKISRDPPLGVIKLGLKLQMELFLHRPFHLISNQAAAKIIYLNFSVFSCWNSFAPRGKQSVPVLHLKIIHL